METFSLQRIPRILGERRRRSRDTRPISAFLEGIFQMKREIVTSAFGSYTSSASFAALVKRCQSVSISNMYAQSLISQLRREIP